MRSQMSTEVETGLFPSENNNTSPQFDLFISLKQTRTINWILIAGSPDNIWRIFHT